MSGRINLAITDILESDKKIPKQLHIHSGSDTYYDDLCRELPLALIGRKFNEKEAERVFQFLKALHYDFQFANTIRAIFALRNTGEVEDEWTRMWDNDKRNKYFWEQLGNIGIRIDFCDSTEKKTFQNAVKVLLNKMKGLIK